MRKEFIDRIKGEEGFSPTSYWDDAPGGGGGQWTWGYGTKAPGPNALITEERATIELVKELVEAENDFRVVFPIDPPDLNQVRYEAIVDMLFNLGLTRFTPFIYTIAAIKSGDWNKAAAHAEASLWYRQVKSRARRIVAELRTGWENGIEPTPIIIKTEDPIVVKRLGWFVRLCDLLERLMNWKKPSG